MSNRSNDVHISRAETLPPLPKIDWKSIGQEAPTVVDLGKPSSYDPLPKADVVVITWTVAEWSALDHVFVNSGTTRSTSYTDFHEEWSYKENADPQYKGSYLWGSYRMVKITNANGKELDVLLWKASAHLSHPPYGKGLEEMVRLILEESQPSQLYSIGTSGGASVNECLGDAVITNCGEVKIQQTASSEEDKEKKKANEYLNGVTVKCDTWFPSNDLFEKVESNLLYKLDQVVTLDELKAVLHQTIYDPKTGNPSWEGTCTIEDLINDAIDPSNLGNPKGINKKDVPILTTDYYYIATPDDGDKYAALEMDDTVVGLAAKEKNTDFAFVRNISDPVVPFTKKNGEAFADGLRNAFSGQIYSHFGFYSSMNGALLTWAAIAGDTKL
jgi:nucleoside phosphorylase